MESTVLPDRSAMELDKSIYAPYDCLMLRSPLLPVEATRGWLADPDSTGRAALNSPVGLAIREALLAASPALFDALTHLTDDRNHRKTHRANAALRRYITRMATRTTPFGLFAGIAVGHLGPETNVRVGPRWKFKTRTTPDAQWLLAKVAELESRSHVVKHLSYYTNGTLFTSGGRVYLPHPATLGSPRPDDTISLRMTPIVVRALELAQDGIKYDQLIGQLQVERPSASHDQLVGLVEHLRNSGALVSQLRPTLTSGDPVPQLLCQIEGLPDCEDIRTQLLTVQNLVNTYDDIPIGRGIEALARLRAATLLSNDHVGSSSTVAINLGLDYAASTISFNVADELARGVETLARISSVSGQLRHLENYRRDFLEHYGEGREVPLLVLLDEEVGLGPPAPYQGPPRSRPMGVSPAPYDPPPGRTRALMTMAVDAQVHHRREVALQESDLERLQVHDHWRDILPSTIDVYASIVAPSQDAINAGRYTLVIGPRVGDHPAGRSFGRFVDLLEADGVELLASIAADEQHVDPGRLDAELAYAPFPERATNIAIRPLMTTYEIVDGVLSSVDHQHTIPLNDIVVGITGDRFYLRSMKLNREVHVRSTHLLNFSRAPNACRFAYEATNEGSLPLMPFDWGPARLLPYLPRLRAGKVVLCPAEWHLDRDLLQRATPSEAVDIVERWRQEWEVPRRVMLTEADNRLLLDLDDRESIAEIIRATTRGIDDGPVVLQEVLPDVGDIWTEGQDGHYALELIIPFKKRQLPGRRPKQSVERSLLDIRENLRLPGSDWLYVKLYAGPSRQDELLAGPIREFVVKMLQSEGVDRWFFIRYADPEPHLRLRIHGSPDLLLAETFPAATRWARALMDLGLIKKLVVDTYDRETERYGGLQGIDVAETIFGIDSRAVVEILALERRNHLNVPRTDLALLTIDTLLRSLGLTSTERYDLFQAMVRGQEPMFRASFDRLRHQFHDYRKTALSIVGDPSWLRSQEGGAAIDEQLRSRQSALSLPVEQLKRLEAAEALWCPLQSIISSYVHMHCNRLLGVDRGAEFTAITYLYLLYKGIRHYLPPGFEIE